MTVISHYLFFSVYLIEDKTERVNEAGLHAVLNTLTEHDFQDAFKKCQERWEQRIHAEGDYF
jgi:hypothetical protein